MQLLQSGQAMDRLQKAFYGTLFENEFLRAKGDAFQNLFEKLMGRAYKGDFMPCRPWGKIGDRKNDGFLKSERCLFQVYAPNEMKAAQAIKKIRADFAGAKDYWGVHFEKWVFVHNATDGLPPHVLKLLLEFEESSSGITLEPWGLEELRDVFRKLSAEDLQSWFGWFGDVPSEQTKAEIGFADLKIVLESVADHPASSPEEVTPVPMGKIEWNRLSEDVTVLLKSGTEKAPLVGELFKTWYDETLGERVAAAFRAKYHSLRGNFRSDEIFSKLQAWVAGPQRGEPKHELAVLAVLAYYFESCDIFEEPRKSVA